MTECEKLLSVARNQIGIKESPSGSNSVIYNTEYYGRKVSGANYPWCCAFVWWVFRKAGLSNLFYNGKKTAYCPAVLSWGKKTTNPQPGDLVLFDFKHNGVPGHIGILEKKLSSNLYQTIEGNTSVTSNDNGGVVMRRTRQLSDILCFISISYGVTENGVVSAGGEKCMVSLPVLKKGMKCNAVQNLQWLLIQKGYTCGTGRADGDFGSGTDSSVRKFQTDKKLSSDGIVGEKTWSALIVG